MPKISVLMPTYNHARFVEQAIRSVLDQSFGDFEFLIIDDGSVDGTADVVRRIQDSRISFTALERNAGACTVVNTLLQRMTGDYYCILNSDDMYLPGKLQTQFSFMESHPEYAATFSTVRVIDEHGRPVENSRVAQAFKVVGGTRHEFLNRLFHANFLCHPSVMLRTSVLRKAGRFDERLRQLPDHDLWIRVAQHGNIHIAAEPMLMFRDHGGNTSRKTPTSAFRTAHEQRFILERYRSITDIPDLLQIFPALRDRFPKPADGTHEFLLAHAALSVPSNQHADFAVETLFRLMNDPQQAALLERAYGFRWRDLHEITGKLNIYGLHNDAILIGAIVDSASKPLVQDQVIVRGGPFEIFLPFSDNIQANATCLLQFANPNVVLELTAFALAGADRQPIAPLKFSTNATLSGNGPGGPHYFGIASPTIAAALPPDAAKTARAVLIRGNVKALGGPAATALHDALKLSKPSSPPAGAEAAPERTPPMQPNPAIPTPQVVAASEMRLHLGCGGNVMPNWVNVDIEARPGVIQHDLTRPLPFASGAADFVYSEHFIEHIDFEQGLRLMREVRRVLKPNGVFRLSTPDMLFLIQQYLKRNMTEWANVNWLPKTPCQMVNGGMRLWGHQFVYDEEELSMQLRAAGFGNVQRVGYRESRYPQLSQLECRPFHGELIFEAS